MEKTEEYNFIQNIGVSEEMISELGKFSLMWNEFEATYFNTQCNPTSIKDYDCYHSFDNEIPFSNLINELLKYLQKDKKSITKELIKEKLYSRNRNEYHQELENVLKNDLHGTQLKIGAMLLLLRLRNNMFHGLKDTHKINNQLSLFVAANQLLNYLLTFE